MSKYVLGRVVPIYKGNYNPHTQYEPLDIVTYGGSSFVCLVDSQGNVPTEDDSTYWGLMARHGVREELTPQEIDALVDTVYNQIVQRGVVIDNEYTHTDNNYSDEHKAIVNDIAQNSDKYVNVQADWEQNNPTAKDYIKNKPAMVIDEEYVHTDNNFTDALRTKLQSIQSNAEANVQADWTESDGNSDAYIRHKPTIPTLTSQLTNNSYFVSDPAYVHNPNPFTDQLKAKLEATNVVTDPMLDKLNHIVPEPMDYSITQTSYTIQTLRGNEVYTFTRPLTNLQITSCNVGHTPSMLYFTTGSTFQWQFPTYIKSGQYIEFDPNQSYCVAVMDNIMTYMELED